MLGDVDQDRQEEPQGDAVLRFLQVTPERVKEPERRVRRVIKPFLLAVGKHVRDQSVANVMRERAQDVARLRDNAR